MCDNSKLSKPETKFITVGKKIVKSWTNQQIDS